MTSSDDSDLVRFALDLTVVVVAVTDEVPRILTVPPPPLARVEATGDDEGGAPTLPFGPFDAEADVTLERGLRRWVREQAGLELGYVEQLYTFGDRWRDPRELRGGPRTVSVAYLVLSRETPTPAARWRDWYALLPWEDQRAGQPDIFDRQIRPALAAWIAATAEADRRRSREERVAVAFGLGPGGWDPERALERYELLYEAGLVREAHRDRGLAGEAARTDAAHAPSAALGEAMALDHRRVAATALGRLRGKLRYRPVVFELLAEEFTLLELQMVVEALVGGLLHKQNFRRLVERNQLVVPTGRHTSGGRGRPAELFRFRREVLRERPAPGVGLPEAPSEAPAASRI